MFIAMDQNAVEEAIDVAIEKRVVARSDGSDKIINSCSTDGSRSCHGINLNPLPMDTTVDEIYSIHRSMNQTRNKNIHTRKYCKTACV